MRGPRPVTVRKAVIVGLLWVNVPALAIWLGLFSACIALIPGLWTDASLTVTFWALFAACGGAGWLWWSLMIPKWRLWAYERVPNIPLLKRLAVAVGLMWPTGSFLERTEIKSKEHAARERELERRARLAP